MIQGRTLLFYEPLTPKHYLDQILAQYPYDIDPALVYTLLTKHPAPHPALFTFIDFIRHSRKMLLAQKAEPRRDFNQLYKKMAALTPHAQALLHIHSFGFDGLLHGTHCTIRHIYPYLAYDKITQIDYIHIYQNTHTHFQAKETLPPITFVPSLPLPDLSLNPKQYFALSVTLHNVHGLILLPHHAASLIPALAALYPLTAEVNHHDFLLLYGVKMPQRENIIAYDANEDQYVGSCYHCDPDMISFTECLHMIRSLYAAITLSKHDLTLSAAMLHITMANQTISLLLCDADESHKSTLLEALIQEGNRRDYTISKQFENYGTIHLLDDSLYATGSQIGTASIITPFTPHPFYDNSGEDIYISEGNHVTYRLTPLPSASTDHRFQPIHLIVIQSDLTALQELTQSDEVYPYLSRCSCIPDSFPHTEKDLWYALINTALLNDIPLIAIPKNEDFREMAQILFNQMQAKFSPNG